jgi:hypothetical protein
MSSDLEARKQTLIECLYHVRVMPGEVHEEDLRRKRIAQDIFVKDMCWMRVQQNHNPVHLFELFGCHSWMIRYGTLSVHFCLQEWIVLC